MHDMLFVFDRGGRFIHYYAPTESQLLMSPSEFLGRHYAEVLPGDLAEKMDAAFRLAQGGQVADFEYSLDMGKGRRHFMARLSPLVEDGDFAGVISVSRDITSLVEAERERSRIQKELQKAQKLESMGIMAGGVAHDFNNILEGIIGQADLAMAEDADPDRMRNRLSRIRSAAARASDLSDKMLAYSGKGGRSIRNVDLRSLLDSMRDFLKSSVSSDTELLVEPSAEPAWVIGDPSQLQQMVLNLVMNASEALEGDSGRIEVRLSRLDADRDQLASGYVDDDLRTGRYVRLTVSDNGCGMDEDTASKAFDPFFTTKFTGRGLGLASVLGIVRGHGGAVSVESEPGSGSTFTILLPEATESQRRLYADADLPPAACAAPAGTRPSPPPGRASRRRSSVMVVDDERIILDTASELLSHMGYDVLTASSGNAALDLLGSPEADSVSLVLLDVTMPGMGGLETLREIRRNRPDLPVVVSSGYAKEEIMPRFMELGVSGFLHKPYSLAKLGEAIEDIEGEGEARE
jgi:PAS domain S-box-containing protein